MSQDFEPVVVRLMTNRLGEMAQRIPQAVGRVVRATAYAIQADVIAGMTGPHAGEVYGRHVASAPGEMPAVDTSALLGSLAVEADPDKTQATVYVTQEYAGYLEYGAPLAHIEPRPFFSPAAERARQGFLDDLAELERQLR